MAVVCLAIYGLTSPDAKGKKGRRLFAFYEVERAGSHIRVASRPDLNPVPGENFIITAWFKLFKLPEEGETFTLLSKIDSQLRSQRGYRLSITREQGRLRPVVYWRNAQSLGGSYKFSSIDLNSRVWVLFGISYTNERYLGLHAVIRSPGKKPQVLLLGGYALSVPVFPDAATDLYAGSFAGAPYKGLLGPLSIVSFKDRKESLYRIYKEISGDGEGPYSVFAEKQVKLLIDDAKSDRSIYKGLVTISSGVRSKEEGESGARRGHQSTQEHQTELPVGNAQPTYEVVIPTPTPTAVPTAVLPTRPAKSDGNRKLQGKKTEPSRVPSASGKKKGVKKTPTPIKQTRGKKKLLSKGKIANEQSSN